jgi:hypothetical protein
MGQYGKMSRSGNMFGALTGLFPSSPNFLSKPIFENPLEFGYQEAVSIISNFEMSASVPFFMCCWRYAIRPLRKV